MEYSIHWTRRASIDVAHIYDFYLKLSGTVVANNRLRKISDTVLYLKRFPYIGRIDDENLDAPTHRYLIVLDYKIYYFIEEDSVYIATIWDNRQGAKPF